MGTNTLYRNTHTDPRQEKEPGFIVSYCAGPVPSTSPGFLPVQCEQAVWEQTTAPRVTAYSEYANKSLITRENQTLRFLFSEENIFYLTTPSISLSLKKKVYSHGIHESN